MQDALPDLAAELVKLSAAADALHLRQDVLEISILRHNGDWEGALQVCYLTTWRCPWPGCTSRGTCMHNHILGPGCLTRPSG